MPVVIDPLALAQRLIRCPSVTPMDAGALDVLANALTSIGFDCHRLTFTQPGTAPVANLYARRGRQGPNLCFAGHTDVVPPGEITAWSVDPFAGEVRDDRLFGRGAADMKAAIACFVAAADRLGGDAPGSLSLLITGDEEGPAVNGTRKVLAWLAERGETLDACLIGEPTNPSVLGEMIKIGRRGSLNASITVEGVQGHAAYPERADNPIPRLLHVLGAIEASPLDGGSAEFQPSTVTITSVDVGNPATNVIPRAAHARLNIRFNDQHSCASLRQWLDRHCRHHAARYTLAIECSGEPFLSPPSRLREVVCLAVEAVIGRRPELSTTGGTSDGRFIKDVCPVVEFGMVGATAHQVDENIPVADIERLTAVYGAVLDGYFADGR